MKILTTAAITAYRDFTKRRVKYARYKCSGAWHTVSVLDVSTTSSGTVEIVFQIDASEAGTGTITEVQLYDTENQLWASKSESLSLASVAEGFCYVVQLNIEEKEDSN